MQHQNVMSVWVNHFHNEVALVKPIAPHYARLCRVRTLATAVPVPVSYRSWRYSWRHLKPIYFLTLCLFYLTRRSDDIELFLACVFDDLDLECDISCGLLESPTPTPTSGGDQVNAEGDASAIQGQKGTSSAHGLSNSVGMTMMAMALVVHVF